MKKLNQVKLILMGTLYEFEAKSDFLDERSFNKT